jgi:hypothetical protein
MTNLRLALLLSALSLTGCATKPIEPATFEMTDSTVYFSDSQGPSPKEFNASISKALAGDDRELASILSLARFTDGEGALNYGETLLKLQSTAGPHRFTRALESLNPDDRRRAQSIMESASALRLSLLKHNPPNMAADSTASRRESP